LDPGKRDSLLIHLDQLAEPFGIHYTDLQKKFPLKGLKTKNSEEIRGRLEAETDHRSAPDQRQTVSYLGN
jgi:hypothetical protein